MLYGGLFFPFFIYIFNCCSGTVVPKVFRSCHADFLFYFLLTLSSGLSFFPPYVVFSVICPSFMSRLETYPVFEGFFRITLVVDRFAEIHHL